MKTVALRFRRLLACLKADYAGNCLDLAFDDCQYRHTYLQICLDVTLNNVA